MCTHSFSTLGLTLRNARINPQQQCFYLSSLSSSFAATVDTFICINFKKNKQTTKQGTLGLSVKIHYKEKVLA